MESKLDNTPDSTPQNETEEKLDQMTTLASIMDRLRVKHVDCEFRWTPEGFSAGKGKFYQPEDLTIVKLFRFEGESDPADSSVLYIIEANDGLKGYSLDAYGVYSNHEDEEGYDNFIRKIKVAKREEQMLFEL